MAVNQETVTLLTQRDAVKPRGASKVTKWFKALT
jgi:hypothetical protein